ncbi:unnamed protein product, partial [Rhizoctonia solani]
CQSSAYVIMPLILVTSPLDKSSMTPCMKLEVTRDLLFCPSSFTKYSSTLSEELAWSNAASSIRFVVHMLGFVYMNGSKYTLGTLVWMILETLANAPHLAFHVKALEFRDFPNHLNFDERHRIIALATQAISNCVNLRSCSWTRDGTLSTRMLQELAGLESLKELEINAKPGAFGAWFPEDLLAFRGLQSLTLIMPARSIVELLPAWSAENKDTLESLVVICKDALAQALVTGRHLRNVHLTLMTDVAGEMRPLHLLTAQEICQHVARNCGDSLQLIGSQTRVWQVKRSFSHGETIRTLGPYSGQQIPEQFLMMRA